MPRAVIAFASLILSLVVGVQPVELLVGDRVATVALVLDGVEVTRLDGPPWRTSVDFGAALRPHLLEAVAWSQDGAETGRARQWINVPRSRAETSVVLEGGEGGAGVEARVAWRNLFGDEPTEVLVSFDGRPLSFEDPRRIPLPAFDPAALHFLRVELRFPQGVSSVAEKTFGGVFGDQVSSELTAVPVVVERGRLPRAAELAGWFRARGKPLRVLATDEGAEEVVAVLGPGGRAALDRMVQPILEAAARASRGSWQSTRQRAMARAQAFKEAAPLGERQRLRIIDTRPTRLEQDGYAVRIFPSSSVFDRRGGGLIWLLSQVRPLERPPQPERVADAVAAAALAAARQNRRRVIVLILGGDAGDESVFEPARVRAYLRDLRVPLVVWRAGGKKSARPEWGAARPASSVSLIEGAFRAVRRDLKRQRIVWLEGAHLPQEIELSPAARGVRLAGADGLFGAP